MSRRVALRRRRRAAATAGIALIAATTLALAPSARAAVFLSSAEQGAWTAADKELHFAGSLAIAASLRVTGATDGQALAGAVSVGVLKELYDVTLKPGPAKRGASWKDLAADVLGAAAGILILRAME